MNFEMFKVCFKTIIGLFKRVLFVVNHQNVGEILTRRLQIFRYFKTLKTYKACVIYVI